MGEIFEKTSPNKSLSWTGERLTDGAGRQVEIEHLHRYLLARSLCRGLDVLDVASGEGYGSAFLAQTAKSVVGVEIDPAAVQHAQDSYTTNNLRFVLGDARRIPIADESVDVVVSFETIEHFYEHDAFLAEIRRVLRPGGRLVVSSPDRDVYSPAGQPPNPFHVHELTKSEFLLLLKEHFKNVSLWGQRPIVGSVLIAEDAAAVGAQPTTVTFERRGETRFEVSDGLPRAVYLLAVASDISIESVPDSLYIDSHTVEHETDRPADEAELVRVSTSLTEAGAYARHVEEELHHRDQEITGLKATLEQIEKDFQHAQTEKVFQRAEADRDFQRVQEELHQKDDEIADLKEQSREVHSELRRRSEEVASAKASLEKTSGTIEHLEQSLAARTQSLKAGLVARDRALSQSNHVNKRIRAELLTATEKCTEFVVYSQQLEEKLLHAQAQRERESLKIQDLQIERERDHGRIQDLHNERDAESRHVQDLLAALETRSAELRTILGSTSWKITEPLRSLLRSNPTLRQVLRRSAKLMWWSVTLQLPARLAQRRRARSSPTVLIANDTPPMVAPAIVPTSIPDAEPRIPESPDSLGDDVVVDVPLPLDLKADFTRQAKSELADFLSSSETLSFEVHSAPDITVVVVIWNQAHLTLRCLRALHGQLGPSIEVVLVDNASTDETASLLARLQGVSVISNVANEGFLLGCNRGASEARGRTILLLNSDAFVRDGALSAALRTLDLREEIGAVGGKLVLPTGKLQEAGSIIWSDASTIAYGRGLNLDAGEVMFRRDIDYCSGAFLLTPRKLWEQIGGLDTEYLPAYYEETDYCMRLREAGFRVVYEPDAVIDHFEFGSEEKSGDSIKLSLKNRKAFRARHASSLKLHHFPNVKENVLAARTRIRPGQKRLLVIDNEVPLVSLGAGYPRAAEILREAVAANWAVTFFPLHQLEIDWDLARADVPAEIEIVSDMAVMRFAEFIEVRRGYYDVIFVSRPDNMKIVRDILRDRPYLLHGVRLVYDAEALFSARDIARSRFEGKHLSAEEIDRLTSSEVALADDADVVTCVSDTEAEAFRSRQEKPVVVLSHKALIVANPRSFDSRSGFLFIGRLMERDSPNWTGLSWFIRECWPLIYPSLPGVTLSVVGRLHPDHEELAQPGVTLVGTVADLTPFYSSARVFVSPVLFAAGVPLKIIDATSAGLPTVGTRLMSSLLAWKAGVDILAEDEPAAFATAALTLHEEVGLWNAVRRSAIKRVEQEHGSRLFREQLSLALNGRHNATLTDGSERDDAHRIARVEAVWSKPVPTAASEQWSKYPLSHPLIQAAMNKRATGAEDRDPYVHLMMRLKEWGFDFPIRHAASLCCGAGALERTLAKLGLLEGCVGFDLSAQALEQAAEAARNEGFLGLDYRFRDLEHDGIGLNNLELVLAHQAVHHISGLEAVFDAVHEALVPGGVFHLHEFVGPDRFQWPDRQVEEMTAWLQSLPRSYQMTLSGLRKDHAGRATIEEMMICDPSEAVRSSAIDSLVSARFEIVERHLIGGNLSMMALADIGHNFDPASSEAKAHIDRLLAREDELIASGELKSDFAIILARKRAL